MHRPRFTTVLILGLAWTTLGRCQTPAQTEPEDADKRILQEVREHNQLMRNMEHLSDVIGPRLTGSDQLKAAELWATDVARQYGLENVHLEPWSMAHSWQRGNAEAQIIQPTSRRLTVVSAGWSPSTNGPVRGLVVCVTATNHQELQSFRGKLKGAIVMLSEPTQFTSHKPPGTGPLVGPPIQSPAPPERGNLFEESAFNKERMAFLRDEGVSAVLSDSGKRNGLFNVFYVAHDYDSRDALPTAMLTHEDYSLIWRLVQKGSVEMELDLRNSFSESPVEAHNVIAEIRGAEKPEEVVILCAHLDSWDLASGSTDDGVGVVAVLEAMRAIKALGLLPKRTIRLVLFTGEEQGNVGSREYVRRHRDEWPLISAVLDDDTGTEKIATLRLHQNYAARETVDTTLAPLRELNLFQPWMERMHGSDYAQFNAVGVPAFSLFSNSAIWSDADDIQHTQADTFDKVDEAGIVHHAQVLAGWAWNTAQLSQLVPRTWKPE